MGRIADSIAIVEVPVGIRRFYATCAEHPRWRPGSHNDRPSAVGDAERHSHDVHDGIDYDGFPADLVAALRDCRDVALRRRIARAARPGWPKTPAPAVVLCADKAQEVMQQLGKS